MVVRAECHEGAAQRNRRAIPALFSLLQKPTMHCNPPARRLNDAQSESLESGLAHSREGGKAAEVILYLLCDHSAI